MEQQRCAPCRFHEVRTVPIPRSWSNRGAHHADSTIVEQQRCAPCQEQRCVPIPRSWSHCHFWINRHSIDDRVDRADRKITIGCLFHGACWGAIALPNSGKKSSMFQVGPLAVEIVLDLHGSHENFQSRWTISFAGREYINWWRKGLL